MGDYYLGYPPGVCRFIEEKRTFVEFEEPAELYAQIGEAVTESGMYWYDYEHRYLDIHFPMRLCPACRDVVRMRVEVDRLVEERRRECPECGPLGVDEHVDPEGRQAIHPVRRRLRRRRLEDDWAWATGAGSV